MSIYARMCWEEEPHLNAHAFPAAVKEVRRGKLTAIQVGTAFGLSAAERQQVGDVVTQIQNAVITFEEFQDIAHIADDASLTIYNTSAKILARIGL